MPGPASPLISPPTLLKPLLHSNVLYPFFILNFLRPSDFNLDQLCEHRLGSIHWCLMCLPMSTKLKKMNASILESISSQRLNRKVPWANPWSTIGCWQIKSSADTVWTTAATVGSWSQCLCHVMKIAVHCPSLYIPSSTFFVWPFLWLSLSLI